VRIYFVQMNTNQFITTLPIIVVGLAAFISLISFRNHYPLALRQMSVLWVVNFLMDLAGHITSSFNIKNHWIYNIYYWILYITLAYLYDKQIQNSFVHKSIRWFFILFPLLIITESVISGITDLQPFVIVIGDIFMIYLLVAYFRQLYMKEENESITRDPWFWFSFGFLVHFGGTAPFLGMLKFLWNHYPTFTRFYYSYFSNSFTILLNLLIITGFLCSRRVYHSRT
jgi:hypothetical protein